MHLLCFLRPAFHQCVCESRTVSVYASGEQICCTYCKGFQKQVVLLLVGAGWDKRSHGAVSLPATASARSWHKRYMICVHQMRGPGADAGKGVAGWIPTDWISITSAEMKGVKSECWTKPAKNEAKCVCERENVCVCVFSDRSWPCGLDESAEEQSKFTLHSVLFHSICVSSGLSSRGCSSSETESEAGDLLDQQFEELNNKLNSVTDPTGFLRMVSRNNLFNR